MGKRKEEDEEVVYIKSYYDTHKVLIWIFVMVIALIVALTLINRNNSNNKPPEEETVIVIKPDQTVTVGIGNSVTLVASVDGNINNVINWTSSDENIAKVSNGTVTGINYGKVIITASYIDSDNVVHKTSKEVTVADGNSSVTLTDAKFPDGDLYMPVGGNYQLSLELIPSNALIKEKAYISTDQSVATVDANGLVKAIKTGHARVIATINGNISRSIEIYVSSDNQKSELIISPSSIYFDSDTRKIKLGDSETLNYSISPSNSDRTKLKWASSDTSIVSVNDVGKITAKKEGKAVVRVTSINGKKDNITIEVYTEIVPVTDITITTTNLKMEAGKTQIITPVVVPSNASNQGLSYTSLDASVVSVTPSADGKSVTLSALNAGSTTIIVRSGNIEKRMNVTVEGNGNNSNANEDDPNLPTTIQVRSNKNNLAKSYDEAVKIPVAGTTTVSVNLSVGVGRIDYCVNKYGASPCTPNISMSANDTIEIPSGSMYVLRIKKFDYRGNEITSTSKNYIDGVLNYYINTKSSIPTPKEYTVTNAYETISLAKGQSISLSDKVTVTLTDTDRYLKVCYTADTNCTPNLVVTKSYTFQPTKVGTWKLYVSEYTNSNSVIGKTEVYYANVINTPTPTPNLKVRVTASNMKVIDGSAGKYLAVDLVSDLEFNSPRFCYALVNKNAVSSCKLDLTSSSVEYYDNGTIVRPKEELKTYYATMTRTKNYSFKYYIRALDDLFNNNDTTKDVIFEFAVNTKEGFSDPIRIRIHMNSKSGNTANWSATLIK